MSALTKSSRQGLSGQHQSPVSQLIAVAVSPRSRRHSPASRASDGEDGGGLRLQWWRSRMAVRWWPQPRREAERAAAAVGGGHQPGVPVPPLPPRHDRAAAPSPAPAAATGRRRGPGPHPAAGRHPRGRIAAEPPPLVVPSPAASPGGAGPLLPPRPRRVRLLRAPGPPPPLHVLHPLRALPRRRPLPRRAPPPPRMPSAAAPQVLLPDRFRISIQTPPHRPLLPASRRRRPMAQGGQVQILLLPAAVAGLRRGAHGGRTVPPREGALGPDGAAAAAVGLAQPGGAHPARARHWRRHGHAGGAAQEARQRHGAHDHNEPGRALLGSDGGARGGAAACAAAAAVPGSGRDHGRGACGARREPLDPGGSAGVPVVRRGPCAAPRRAALGGPLLVPEE